MDWLWDQKNALGIIIVAVLVITMIQGLFAERKSTSKPAKGAKK